MKKYKKKTIIYRVQAHRVQALTTYKISSLQYKHKWSKNGQTTVQHNMEIFPHPDSNRRGRIYISFSYVLPSPNHLTQVFYADNYIFYVRRILRRLKKILTNFLGFFGPLTANLIPMTYLQASGDDFIHDANYLLKSKLIIYRTPP